MLAHPPQERVVVLPTFVPFVPSSAHALQRVWGAMGKTTWTGSERYTTAAVVWEEVRTPLVPTHPRKDASTPFTSGHKTSTCSMLAVWGGMSSGTWSEPERGKHDQCCGRDTECVALVMGARREGQRGG